MHVAVWIVLLAASDCLHFAMCALQQQCHSGYRLACHVPLVWGRVESLLVVYELWKQIMCCASMIDFHTYTHLTAARHLGHSQQHWYGVPCCLFAQPAQDKGTRENLRILMVFTQTELALTGVVWTRLVAGVTV